jgi:hypothetical protein
VASSFTHYSTYSQGTISLSGGNNALRAAICNYDGICGEHSVSYYRDTQPPTVTISPSGGTYGTSNVAITVQWSDDRALNGASRKITLDGTDITWRFGYWASLSFMDT